MACAVTGPLVAFMTGAALEDTERRLSLLSGVLDSTAYTPERAGVEMARNRAEFARDQYMHHRKEHNS
jgi:hypothetical protein